MNRLDESVLPEQGSMAYFTGLCLIAAIGGFLFGFDTAVISGAIDLVTEQFRLDAMMKGWVVSSALVGCVIGSAVGGSLCDRFGRKRVLVFSALMFSVTGVGCSIAWEPHLLTVARCIGGVGVGVAGMVVPLYIAEISPPHLRGRMIACYQFAITIGVVAAYLSNAVFRELSVSSIESLAAIRLYQWMVVEEVWRGMMGSLVLPAGAFLVLLAVVPESPRWLARQGRRDEALAILARIAGRDEAEREIDEIARTVSHESAGLGQLLQPGTRWALLMAIALAVAAQLSGINAVVYYGPTIFKTAGFAFESALGVQVFLGMVNVVFTVLAMWKVDTLGRRPLLLAGGMGVSLALVLIAGLFASGAANGAGPGGLALVVLLCAFLACFAFSLGPLPWIFMAEVFPTAVRGRAMSLATLALWSANTVVCQTFPWLSDHLGPAWAFFLYATMVAPLVLFVWRVMPETKGQSLEALEARFASS